MAGTRKRRCSMHDVPEHALQFLEEKRGVALAADVPFAENGHEAPGLIVYVLGVGAGVDRHPAQRDFPLVKRRRGQKKAAHLAQVARLVDEAMAAGGTHLLVPREHADWLGDYPHVAKYFAEHHDLADANPETGITFALRPRQAVALGQNYYWVPSGDVHSSRVAHQLIEAPTVELLLDRPLWQCFRLTIDFRAEQLETLKFSFDLQSGTQMVAFVNLLQPYLVLHQLPFLELRHGETEGSFRLDLDLNLPPQDGLETITIEVENETNWRMQVWYIWDVLREPNLVPPAARLEIENVRFDVAARPRNTGRYHNWPSNAITPRSPSPPGVRDAVVFASYIPEDAIRIGEEFLDVLRRHHADSKIFVGVNHGSCETWYHLLADSGLDLEVCRPGAQNVTRSEAASYLAALDGFRHSSEQFHLVWFGHTKGTGKPEHINSLRYGKVRWTVEKRFWARRKEIEEYFDDPRIGLYTPHNFVPWIGSLGNVEALQRMFPSNRQPLAQWAMTAFFVLRAEIVKTFCNTVDEALFTHGVEMFGASLAFFEDGFPNIASLQGYEPYIEEGVGRTTLPLTAAVDFNVWADERQNHHIMRRELERWRADTCGYSPGLAEKSREAVHVLAEHD